MQKSFCCTVGLIVALMVHFPGFAKEKGTTHFELGVFSYEDQNYNEALNNFKTAVQQNPDNSLFHQYLGKTYNKLGDHKKAEYHLYIAWKKDPENLDIVYDLGMTNLQLENFSSAKIRFSEILTKEPNHVLARYQMGIVAYKQMDYIQAKQHFLKASDINPSVKPNGYYYAGICDLKVGDADSAVNKFSWVQAHANTADLKKNASKWLEIAKKQKKANRPYSLSAKLGFQYDTNVPLEPSDKDIYADKDDAGMELFLSGKYHFFKRHNIIIGAGYDHYQTAHYDLSQYNIVGLTPSLFAIYNHTPFTFNFSYLPTYYILDNDSYMLQHRVSPEATWEIQSNLYSRISFSYYDNIHYINEDRDGYTLEITTDIFYSLLNDTAILYCGIGYAKNSASHTDYDYSEVKPFSGAVYKAPFSLELAASFDIYLRKYDHENTIYQDDRDDIEFNSVISLSRRIKWEWLAMSLEYGFSSNSSNIEEYEYTRNLLSLFCIVKY